MQGVAGKLFVISAPSGAGKTTLVNALLRTKVGLLSRVTTYTTKPRPLNQADTEYHFISVEEFQAKIAQGFFLEWSTAYGTYYGSPAHIIDAVHKGNSYIMIVDRAGAQALAKVYPAVILIWIYTSDIAILSERLYARARDTHAQIEARLHLAKDEIEQESKNSIYCYHICNDVFSVALESLENIVQQELFVKSTNELNLKYSSKNQG